MSFLDAMLHMSILAPGQLGLYLPTRFTSIRIDPVTHRQKLYTLQDTTQGSAGPAPTPPGPHTRCHPHSPRVSPQRPTWWWTGI